MDGVILQRRGPIPLSSNQPSSSGTMVLAFKMYEVGPIQECKKVKLSRYTPWRRLGERRYSSYLFLTSALDGGEWSASRPGRALPPGKEPPVPIGQEAGWAPEPVWTQRLEEKSSCLCRGSNPSRPVRSQIQECTDEIYSEGGAMLFVKLLQSY
jgi:hypothetical protein